MAKVEYKYPSDIVEQTRAYIDSCSMEQMEIPTVEGLALLLDVNDDTLVEWAKIHDDFKHVYDRLKMKQKVQLINGGAFGGKDVNGSMFIFLLKANHGMIETEKKMLVDGEGNALVGLIQVNESHKSLTMADTSKKG